jgi:hypothetical protein
MMDTIPNGIRSDGAVLVEPSRLEHVPAVR